MKKILGGTLIYLLLFGIFIGNASAYNHTHRLAVKWDASTLVEGQIGRVTLLEASDLYFYFEDISKTKNQRKKESIYRVYNYKKIDGVYYYGVGAGFYIKDTQGIFYETPSSVKKRQLKDLVIVDLITDPTFSLIPDDGKLANSYPLHYSIETISELTGYPIKMNGNVKILETPLYIYYQNKGEQKLSKIQIHWPYEPSWTAEKLASIYEERNEYSLSDTSTNKLLYGSIYTKLTILFQEDPHEAIITLEKMK
ncbi:hypothetical protein [Rossellomorea aquimaris]|uniref:hypothetical protein n=1 Tax=Rossellomorea aquimaris TaxID=189382 RepID=UPI0007D0A6B5|nr:hypothetical protein [Rossellomorea aquimaris]